MALPLTPRVSQGRLSQDNLSRDSYSKNAKPSLKNSCYNDSANILMDWKIERAIPVVLLTDYAISNDISSNHSMPLKIERVDPAVFLKDDAISNNITANHSVNLKIKRVEPTPFLTNSSGVNSSIVSGNIAGYRKIKCAESRVVLEDVDELIERMLIEFPINFIDEVLSMSSFKLDEEVGKDSSIDKTSVQSFRCSFCSISICESQVLLEKHFIEKHHNLFAETNIRGKRLKCSFCDYFSNEHGKIMWHLKQLHIVLMEGSTKIFKCSVCLFRCTQKDQLKLHYVSKHAVESSRNLMRNHKEMLVKQESSITCPQNFDRNSTGQFYLDLSATDTSSSKPWKCSACDHRSNRRFSIKLHFARKHGIDLVKADPSDAPSQSLIHDIREMTDDIKQNKLAMFKCQFCTKICKLKGELKTHLAGTHSRLDAEHLIQSWFPEELVKESDMEGKNLNKEVGKVESSRNLMHNHKEKSVKQESSITCPQNFDRDATGQYFYLDLSATDTSSSKPWKCSTCDHRSNRRFSIKRHFARKHSVESVKADPSDAPSQSLIHDIREINNDVKQNESATFKCQFCAKICKLRGDLKTHLVGRHSRLDAEHLIQSWFQEELAKVRDMEEKNVSDKDHIKLFKCLYCDFRANRLCFVEKHTSEVHKINSINENNIDENSDKPQLEGEHSLFQNSDDKSEIIISRPFTSSVDKGAKPFKCSFCDHRTRRRFDLKKHEKTHNKTEAKKIYKCSKCDFQSHNLESFKKHGKSHTQPQINCPHCGLSYSRYLFARHLKKRHPEIVALNQKPKETKKPLSFDCPECDFVGETRLKLKSHYKYRHSPKIYMCHKCDYRCRTNFALATHFISHQVERPFKCDKCPFAGKTKSHLAKHRGVHLTERPFKCDRCSYTAQTRRNLNNHLYCHGDYKYRCKECGKLFKRPSLLYLHKKRLHKVEKEDLHCQLCDYSTKTKPHLRWHLINHRRNKKKALKKGQVGVVPDLQKTS